MIYMTYTQLRIITFTELSLIKITHLLIALVELPSTQIHNTYIEQIYQIKG